MNKQELKEKVKSLESFNPCTGTDFEWGFDVCRHEVLSLIQALDEPQKVKVPEFVAEWIEYVKKKGDSFYDSFKPWDLYGAEYVEADRWITNNGEEYARAWIDGYEVEEEPKYRVLFPCDKRKTGHQFSYLMEDGRQCYCSDLETIPELTESTIKSIDERYWPFAVPVEKV